MIWSVLSEKTHTVAMLCCIISLQFELNVEQGKVYSKADLSNGNGTVCYLAVNTLIVLDLSIQGRGVGVGGWKVLAVKVCLYFASSVPGVWLVWQWTPAVLLADQMASEAILFSWILHLLLDPGYTVPPASHTKCSLSASTWYWRLYFFTSTRGTFTSKNQHMPV